MIRAGGGGQGGSVQIADCCGSWQADILRLKFIRLPLFVFLPELFDRSF